MTYYISGRSGDSYIDKSIHHDEECPALQDGDGSTRPISEAAIEQHKGITFCPECEPLGNDVDDAGDDGDETCNVTKADGEVCGRDLPCQYHSYHHD